MGLQNGGGHTIQSPYVRSVASQYLLANSLSRTVRPNMYTTVTDVGLRELALLNNTPNFILAIKESEVGEIIHFRIAKLELAIRNLPVSDGFRAQLLVAVKENEEVILERPMYRADEGLDDLEAVQQLVLGNQVEMWFHSLAVGELAKKREPDNGK